MMNGAGRCSAGRQMGSAQSNKQNRNSLDLVKPAQTKALTKSLVHPSDTPVLTSKRLSCLRMEVVQPAKLLMEVKWGVEGWELVSLLEFSRFFPAAGGTDCGSDSLQLELRGALCIYPRVQV